MRKLLVPLGISLVLIFLITGCAGTSSTPAKPAATTWSVTTPIAAATQPAATAPAVTKPSVATTAATTPAQSAAPTANKYGGVLRWIEPAAPSAPIGAVWESPFGNSSQQLCFDPLLLELADGSLHPWLASYEVVSDTDKPSYTLKFRKGIKFHDGTDLNAPAVKWGIQKLMDSGLFASVRYFKSVEVVDDYTLFLPLTEWRNSNLPALAKSQHWVVSPAAFEKNGLDWIRTHMVGSGPFMQTDYQRDVSVTTTRFGNYWDTGKPYLDGIQYLFVSDLLTQIALFKSGGADIYNTNMNARVASELAAEGYKVITQMSNAASLIPDSNNAASPWSNFKVREAAEYALDKDSIARAFGFGYWKGATQAPSPAAPAHNPALPGRKYDAARAKQLLTEAGYPNGFKTRVIAQDTANRDVVIAVQSYLGKVGIQVELEFAQASKVVDYQAKGWSNGLLFTTMGFEGNIIPSMGFNFPPDRTGRYTVVKDPPRWRELYDKVAKTPTLENSIMQECTRQVYEDLMWIPIYWQPAIWVLKDNVQDTGLGTRAGFFWNTHNTWFRK